MASHVHMTMLEGLKRAAWARTSPVSTTQLNAWEFRKDCLGNLVRFTDYGNRHSPFGWELDTISRNVGLTDPDNLQALHWKTVAARSDALPKSLVAAVQRAA